MLTRWLSIFALVILAGPAVRALDTIYIEAELHDSTRSISGELSVSLTFDDVPDDLHFRLFSNTTCDTVLCGVEIESLYVEGSDRTASVVISDSDVRVPLVAGMGGDGNIDVRMKFVTHIPESGDRFGYYDEHYSLETWFPMPAPYRDGEWLIIDYGVNAEPVADFFDFDVTITYPDTLQLIAPGVKALDTLSNTVQAKLVLEESHEFSIFFGSDYLLDSSAVGETSIKVYYRESDSYVVDTVREAVRGTLEFMSDEVIPYRYDEMIAVIDGIRSGGLELPRMTFLQKPPVWMPVRYYHELVIHEVVHQWFYGMIASDQANHPWLDESTTEYFTSRVNKSMCGDQPDMMSSMGMTLHSNTFHRVSSRRSMNIAPINMQSWDYELPRYFSAVYAKGDQLFKTLGRLMGEEKENAFWREYGSTYLLGYPTPSDFYAIADRYLPDAGESGSADIIGFVGEFDLEIVSVSSERNEPDSSDEESPEDVASFSSEIEFAVRYSLDMPVTVRMVFQGGSTVDTVVVPSFGYHKIEYESDKPVIGAIIDPDNVYAIDIDLLNNSYVPGIAGGTGLRLSSGLTFLLELLYGVVWGL